MSDTYNYFIPSVRQGLAAAIPGEPESEPPHRACIDVALHATARRKGATEEDDADIEKSVYLYGPGDILGFHDRIIARCHPENHIGDFEPNFFPSIFFADADFVWRFTADKAEDQTGKLLPWITLIVLVAETRGDVQQEFIEEPRGDRNLPPNIIVSGSALPDLQHSWRWAHSHITEASGKEELLEQIVRETPEAVVSRLLCARRLAPKIRYRAFVVPTFKLGVMAGLGLEPDSEISAMVPAWMGNGSDEGLPYHVNNRNPDWPQLLKEGVSLKLPYYYHWEFGTGLRGDFEHLIRLLEPRKLSGLGIRDIDCHYPGFRVQGVDRPGLDSPEKHYLGMEGALKSVDTRFTAWGQDRTSETALVAEPMQEDLCELLNQPKADMAPPELDSDTTSPLPSVVPPIYGRWHRGRDTVTADNRNEWLDVLNLDPRHRAAGGLGSEVIRKQQEPLMASAWDQLGAIESANDILRRAQFGRETSQKIHDRMNHLPEEDLLRITAPVQNRVLIQDPQNDRKMTAAHYMKTQTRIPEAALDSSFRRIMRPRGPVRKRQKAGRSVDLLKRLASGDIEAAGPAPKPFGTTRLCDITQGLKENLVPSVTLTANPSAVDYDEPTTLTWVSENTTSCTATGYGWSGSKSCSGSEEIVPFPSGGASPGPGTVSPDPDVSDTGTEPIPGHGSVAPEAYYSLACNGPLGGADSIVKVIRNSGAGATGGIGVPDPGGGIDDSGSLNVGLSGGSTLPLMRPYSRSVESDSDKAPLPLRRRFVRPDMILRDPGNFSVLRPEKSGPDSGVRFCDGFMSCKLLEKIVKKTKPFEEIEEVPDPQKMISVVCDIIDNWLDKQPEMGEPEKPVYPDTFVGEVKELVFQEIDPGKTVLDRTKKRIRLAGDLAKRFDAEFSGDPLAPILCAPEFPQPMYEPLRDMSHDLLLPGVETIPQNTIGLLQTNRRFLESYMGSLNHSFAGELLWRGFPTDQKKSYFRQFWDVSEYVPREHEREELLAKWLQKNGQQTGQVIVTVSDVSRQEKERVVWRNVDIVLELLLSRWAIDNEEELQEADQQKIVFGLNEGLRNYVSLISDQDMEFLVEELSIKEQLDETLKDIKELIHWKHNELGDNAVRPGEDLVLVIRGDLLQRYPNAIIYAIDTVPCNGADGEPVPALEEFLKEKDGSLFTEDRERIETILGDKKRIFPVFKATLSPDLTFFGFPFSDEDARGMDGLGKFFIIEEQVTEPRFGLDVPVDPPPPLVPPSQHYVPEGAQAWPDGLSWAHFGFEKAGENLYYGRYLDNPPDSDLSLFNDAEHLNDEMKDLWSRPSSAQRASFTCQKPVRIAVHAVKMLPDISAYFEFSGPGSDPDSDIQFVIKLTDPEKIDHARNILNGSETERINIKGRVVKEPATYNPLWSYHLAPQSIEFQTSTSGECDATMLYIEDHIEEVGDTFLPNNIWCPSGVCLTRDVTDIL